MRYFIIQAELAGLLGLARFRYGNGGDGYLVNIGDLAVYGVERAVQEGAREVTEQEATEFVNKNK